MPGQLHATKSARRATDLVVYTDWRDDDVHALIYLLNHSATRDSIRAIYTTTGNTFLKAASLRKLVAATGLRIPVVEGTSTDLERSDHTRHAAAWDRNGGHLLRDSMRLHLEQFEGYSGPAAEHFYELLKSREAGSKINVLSLSAPSDLVRTIARDPSLAQEKLGLLTYSGLYHDGQHGSSEARFNTLVDPQATFELLEWIQGGIFEAVYHVPADTMMHRSGLNSGWQYHQDLDYNRLLDNLSSEVVKVPIPQLYEKHIVYYFNDLLVAHFVAHHLVPGARRSLPPLRVRQILRPLKAGLDAFAPFNFEVREALEVEDSRNVRDVMYIDSKLALKSYIRQVRRWQRVKPLPEYWRREARPALNPCAHALKRVGDLPST